MSDLLPDKDSVTYEWIAGCEKIDLALDEETESLPRRTLDTICAVHLGHSEVNEDTGERTFHFPPFIVDVEGVFIERKSPFTYSTDPRICEYLLRRLSDLKDVPTFIELDMRFREDEEDRFECHMTSSGVYVAPSFEGFAAGSLADGCGTPEGHAHGLTPTEALCRFVAVLWLIDHELPPEVGENEKSP